MNEFMVRLNGKPKEYVDKFIEKGYFNTKSEVIRLGIMELASKYKLDTDFYIPEKDELKLLGWKNTKNDKIIISKGALSNNLIPLAFSGIHAISPRIFKLVKISGKFSMTDVYLKLSTFQRINGFRHDDDFWIDLGTPENIEEAEKFLQNKKP